MCGRGATIDKIIDYKKLLPEDFEIFDEKRNSFLLNDLDELPPSYISYNVAPTTNIPVIANAHPRSLQLMPWKYEMKIQGKTVPLFNSKIEQAEKNNSYFRYDLQERRCIVLFKGFYEWIKQDPTSKKTAKQPVFIHLKNSPVMPLAGIFKKNENGSFGCSIITTAPLLSVERVHNRMPFILHPDNMLDYLSTRLDKDKGLVLDWLKNNLVDSESLAFYPVNSNVGKVENKGADLLNQCEPLFDIN